MRHVYMAFPLLVALPVLNVCIAANLAIQWAMPGWLQVHWAALSWGIVSGILAYVFGFCSVAAFATGQGSKWAVVWFGVAVVAVIQVYAGWSSRPNLPPLAAARVSADGVILQTTPFTCVPAAGANVAAILGVHTSEKELVELFHTTRDGTFPAQVLYGLKKLGIPGRKVMAVTGIHAVKPPAMLFIRDDTHAVVYVGMKRGLVEIWNPSFGRTFMQEQRLHQNWDGHALEFARNGN